MAGNVSLRDRRQLLRTSLFAEFRGHQQRKSIGYHTNLGWQRTHQLTIYLDKDPLRVAIVNLCAVA